MSVRAVLLALVVLVSATTVAEARPGSLDRGYGTRGMAQTRALEGAAAAVRAPGGRLLVAGGTYRLGVARFGARGRLDRSFGGGDGVITTRGAGAANPVGILRERSGAVRIAATSARYETPPVQLLTFGRSAGRALVDPTPFVGPVQSGLLRADGGAFVIGNPCSSYVRSCTPPVQVRAVTAAGVLDGRFGGGTVDLCAVVPGPCPGVTAAALRPGGGIVLAVARADGAHPRLLQLTADGGLDAAFGIVTLPFRATELEVARGGAIVAAGHATRQRLARVTRVKPGGAIDRGFGSWGVANVGPRGDRRGSPRDLLVDARGRIYVLASRVDGYGYTETPERRPYVARLTADGRADRRFGRRGVATLPRPGEDNTREGEALLPDRRGGLYVIGKLLVAGQRDPIGGCGIRDDLCAESVFAAVWRLRTR